MSSLVTEALANAGSLAKDDWSTKISKLSLRAFDVKQELYDFTHQSYVEFLPLFSSSEQINTKLSAIRSEVNSLQLSLDVMVKNQIKDSTKEFEQLSMEHSKTLKLVDALEKLSFIHSSLTNHNHQLKSKKLTNAAEELFQIEKLLNELEGNVLVETKIYGALRVEYVVKKQNFLYTLDEVWKDCVSLVMQNGSDSDVEFAIDFCKDNQPVDGQDLIYAMHSSKHLSSKFKKLSTKIFENFMKPCILESGFHLSVKSSPRPTLATGRVNNDTSNKLPTPENVFPKLQTALSFLREHLLKYRLSPMQENDDTLMSLFRAHVSENFINLLIEKCLMDSVPNSKEELQAYDKVEKEVKNFESVLQNIGFFEKDSTGKSSLTEFISNIHVHFSNQRCIAVLSKARSLMKREIYETVLVESSDFGEVPANLLAKLRSGKSSKQNDLVIEAVAKVLKPSKPMDDCTMQLPRFRISSGVKGLVDLAYETLHEASSSSIECALRLIATTENIFELYSAVVPIHHREPLATLPQVSALHYNDCWYIAHHLLTLGHQFSKHLPVKESGIPLTFVHQVPMIRQLGSECFLQQMRRQREILLDCLAPMKKFASNPSGNKYELADKPIKQVAHQLNHLRTVWSDILPTNIRRTSLATLADCAIVDTVSSICAIEDISSEDSIQLSTACRLLQNQVASLFKSSDSSVDLSWQREVKKWQRLDELILVLDSNLRGIVDRWSDGKGPLASAFTVVEVKGLIRAIFQNTEQRANAISKIRY